MGGWCGARATAVGTAGEAPASWARRRPASRQRAVAVAMPAAATEARGRPGASVATANDPHRHPLGPGPDGRHRLPPSGRRARPAFAGRRNPDVPDNPHHRRRDCRSRGLLRPPRRLPPGPGPARVTAKDEGPGPARARPGARAAWKVGELVHTPSPHPVRRRRVQALLLGAGAALALAGCAPAESLPERARQGHRRRLPAQRARPDGPHRRAHRPVERGVAGRAGRRRAGLGPDDLVHRGLPEAEERRPAAGPPALPRAAGSHVHGGPDPHDRHPVLLLHPGHRGVPGHRQGARRRDRGLRQAVEPGTSTTSATTCTPPASGSTSPARRAWRRRCPPSTCPPGRRWSSPCAPATSRTPSGSPPSSTRSTCCPDASTSSR